MNNFDCQTITGATLARIAISRIRPFADQPRKEFDKEELLGLAMSIKEIGQQTPVSIKCLHNNPDYDFELIDGERRYRACKLIDQKSILAVVIEEDMGKKEQFALSVVSNFCRAGHTSLETALALRIIIDGFIEDGIDGEKKNKDECIEKAARICGRSSAWATQHLSLLRLCLEVQDFLVKREISFQIGIALSGLKDEYQKSYSQHILDYKLNHRSALAYIRNHRSAEVVGEKGRSRKPSDDYAILFRTIEKMNSEIDDILDMSMKKIMELFRMRPAQDFDNMVSSLEDLWNSIKLFSENLKAATRK